ncbi:MAG TPA: alpha/beta hydrolase [Acidimicrobiales bacterium]|nr:alpha/beta hydrolase [Acidimicrobiales bacterium]
MARWEARAPIDDLAGERPTRFVTLRDGRALSYMELGDPHGFPILHHHGMPGSRLQQEGEPGLYARLGVRVVTPDRPGYGMSDPNQAGGLLDWADDARQLMDAIGAWRFGVTALSGGGIFALACAAAMPERVVNVALTGCPAPMQIPHAFRHMRFMTRAGVWLAGHLPGVVEVAGDLASGFVRRHPRWVFEQFNRDVPAPDRKWLSMPSVAGGAVADVREGLRHGASGYTRDLELLARPWDFDVSSIRVPVDIWHGAADVVIPPQHGAYLGAAIPGARLHTCPGEGHLVMWSHLPEILLTASGRSTSSGPPTAGRKALLPRVWWPETRDILRVEEN